jgi:hypothetical protein
MLALIVAMVVIQLNTPRLTSAEPRSLHPQVVQGWKPWSSQVAHEITVRPMSLKVIKAWEKAGVRFGRIRIEEFGRLIFFFEAEPADQDEFPAFCVIGNPKLSELPAPDVPFGLVFLCGDTDASMKELVAFKRLQMLDLSSSLVTDVGLKELTALRQLHTLNLHSTQVTDVGLKELTALKQLQTLDLRGTQVTDVGLKELANLAQLQTLNLGFTQITDAGLKELAALKRLQTLDLVGTKVTDAGLKELAALKRLQTLNLGYTQITDAGLKELVAVKQLQSLHLYKTKVTDAGVKELKKALPKCEIID